MKNRIALYALLPAVVMGSVAYADPGMDKQINHQVMQAFQQHPDLGTDVKANTKDGVVYITGKVATGLQKSNAEDLARGVSGVTKVVDNLSVDKGS